MHWSRAGTHLFPAAKGLAGGGGAGSAVGAVGVSACGHGERGRLGSPGERRSGYSKKRHGGIWRCERTKVEHTRLSRQKHGSHVTLRPSANSCEMRRSARSDPKCALGFGRSNSPSQHHRQRCPPTPASSTTYPRWSSLSSLHDPPSAPYVSWPASLFRPRDFLAPAATLPPYTDHSILLLVLALALNRSVRLPAPRSGLCPALPLPPKVSFCRAMLNYSVLNS